MMTTRSFSSPTLLSLLLILLLGACAPRAQRTGYTEETINGVRVRTYHVDTPPEVNPYSFVKSTVFGADQGEDTYLLTSSGTVGVAVDGSILVASRGRGPLHRFSRDGVHMGTIGRSGQGPGEFSMMATQLLDGNCLHYFDSGLMRYTRLSLEGEILELFRYPSDFDSRSSGFVAGAYGPEGERSFLFRVIGRRSNTNTFTFKVSRINSALELIDTPVDTSYSHPVSEVAGGTSPAFSYGWPTSAAANDMPVAWCFDEEFRIEFMNPEDLSRWAVIIPHEAQEVTAALREYELKRRFEQMNAMEEARRNFKFPSHLPHVEGMVWDSSGRLWVKDHVDPTVEEPGSFTYNVFSKEGDWLFEQTLPFSSRVITGEGCFVGTEDEEGNPIVQFYEFVRNRE